jgi:ubiquinol-cytochrome c reductase cytochrome b subunit
MMGKRRNTFIDWIDERYPLTETWQEHLAGYYAPKNFNFWYYLGSLAGLVLAIQLVTGIFLAMYYTPHADLAFGSVEYIMRDVKWGWLIRFMHSTGASAFFVIIYLHMFRGLIYGSFKRPRELVWIAGMVIYILLMAEAFMGYLLPWGQMSYWGAEVITSLFGAIPYVGTTLETWLRGDFAVSNATLNRFFAWHVIAIPLVLLGLVVFHIQALHKVGSNNPDGAEIREHTDQSGVPLDGIPFHPYYTVKDLFGFGIFLIIFCAIVFYEPRLGGWFLEPDNLIPANPLKTPPEIKPLWYLAPFYAILRSVPHKFMGVLTLAGSLVILFLVPWIDRNPVKSHRYRGLLTAVAMGLFGITFVALGYLGTQRPTPAYTDLSFRLTELYFSFFVLSAFYSRPRSTGFYLTALAVMVLLILALDWFRLGDVPLHLMLRSLWIPVLYWIIFLVAPSFTRLNRSSPVPQRVTSQ